MRLKACMYERTAGGCQFNSLLTPMEIGKKATNYVQIRCLRSPKKGEKSRRWSRPFLL